MRFSRQFVLVLYIILAVYVSLFFFTRYPVTESLVKIWALIQALAIVASMLGFGRCILKYIFRIKLNFVEEACFSFVLGLCGLMLYMFLLGAAGLMKPLFVWFFIVSGSALFAAYAKGSRPLFYTGEMSLKQFGMFLPVCISGLLIFIVSFSPPTYYDSLVYHLALPKLYLSNSGIYNVTYNLYSAFPQYAEMLFTACLAVGTDYIINLVGFFIFIFTLAFIYLTGRTVLGRNASFLSLLIYSTVPSVILLAGGAYVESILSLLIIGALLCIVYYQERHDDKFLLLAGVLCGFAFGIKYYAVITIGALNMMLVIWSFREKALLKKLIYFNVPVVIFSVPWLIKNLIYLGNPVFPFFYKAFGWKDIGWTYQTAAGYFNIMTEYGVKGDFLKEFLVMPFNAATDSIKYGGGADILGGIGWPFLILVLPAVFFARKLNSRVKLIGFYLIIHVTVWFFTGHVLRFLTVVIPLIAVLAAFGLSELYRKYGVAARVFISSLTCLYLVSNMFMLANIYDVIEPVNVSLGVETRSAYLNRKLGEFYALQEFLNKHKAPEDKVYILGDQRAYYTDMPYIVTHILLPEKIAVWANGSADLEEFVRIIKDNGLTYILFHKREALRINRTNNLFDFTDTGVLIWEEFLSQVNVIYESKTAALYKI